MISHHLKCNLICRFILVVAFFLIFVSTSMLPATSAVGLYGGEDDVPDFVKIHILELSPDMVSTDGDKHEERPEIFRMSLKCLQPKYVNSSVYEVFVNLYSNNITSDTNFVYMISLCKVYTEFLQIRSVEKF